jgi:hypothetical protein
VTRGCAAGVSAPDRWSDDLEKARRVVTYSKTYATDPRLEDQIAGSAKHYLIAKQGADRPWTT